MTTGRPEFYSALEGTFPIPEYSNMVFTRGDVQISRQQTAFGRYAWQDSDFTCEGCGGRLAIFSGNGIQQKRYSWVGGHTWVLSSRVLNELRGQATNVHFRAHPPGVRPAEKLFDNSPARTAPLTQIYNFPSLVWGSNANGYSLQTQRQIRDDLSIAAGRHTWKVGGGYLHIPIDGDVQREHRRVDLYVRSAVRPGEPHDHGEPARREAVHGRRRATSGGTCRTCTGMCTSRTNGGRCRP